MVRSGWIRCMWLASVGGVLLAAVPVVVKAAPVEELTKRLPDGVIAFAASSGGDAMKEDFAKTSLGRICYDPGVQSFAREIGTQLVAMAQAKSKGDANDLKQIPTVLGLVGSVLSRPLAVGVAPSKGAAPSKDVPPVLAFALLDATGHKADIEGLVQKVETLAGAGAVMDVNIGSARMHGPKPRPPVPVYWGWVGDYFVVAVNDAAGAALEYVQKPRAAAPEYLQKVPVRGDAVVSRVDIQKALILVDAVVRPKDAKVADTITAVLKDVGLSGLRTFTSGVGFAGTDLVAGSFLEAPGPRTGLLAVCKPIDPALMDMVDARAVTAGAANLDAAAAFDTILHAVGVAAPQVGANVEKGLAAFEAQTKVSIRQGLLESLAGPVVHYSLGPGAIPEAPMGGAVVLIKLKNAELFEKTMNSIGEFAAAQSKGAFQATTQKREDGRVVHSWTVAQLAMMQLMPTWSVSKDYAVIGLNPGIYDAALKQMTATGAERRSIRDTPGFKEVAAKLPAGVICLDYADSRAQYTQFMAMAQQFWPMAGMLTASSGIKLPPTLPALDAIIKDMKPMLRARWMTPDGIYERYQGPGIEAAVSAAVVPAVGAAVALPALAKAREQARSVASISHLKQIGVAAHLYAQEHQGQWPADLDQMKPYLGPAAAKVLESPRKPKDFQGPSYIYVAGLPQAVDSRTVMAYENPEYCTDRINVLFADGHVEAMKPDAFRSALQATYEKMGKEMPEIKFKGDGNSGNKPSRPRPLRPGKASQT